MKILVVGDSYIRSDQFRTGLAPLARDHELEYVDLVVDLGFEGRDESERTIHEYEGNPDQIVAALSDHDVLVVHGAPVSRGVLEASPRLRLVCCARGGPVNVDLEAAESLGIRVANTPGKNAAAVADLTLAFAVMLARGVGPALAYLRDGNRLGGTFDGAQFFGSELSGMRLGLIGLGRVGREVCARARGFDLPVLAYDPYVPAAEVIDAGATPVDLDELVSSSTMLSLHARLTPETRHLVDADLLGGFASGGYLINTAREGLVDEDAAMAALATGHLAGIAVDVFEDDGAFARAIIGGNDRLIALPHIGGATHETVARAALMLLREIEAFAAIPATPDRMS